MNNSIDVHGLTRVKAREEIIEFIKICYKNKITLIKVIHGFNNGSVIKDWLRSSNDILNMIEVKNIYNMLPGETIIELNFKSRLKLNA